VHPSLSDGQKIGQLPSHVSGGSTMPLPHVGEQSSSFAFMHPSAQHPSPFVQALIVWCAHTTSHVAIAPVRVSTLQGSPSAHVGGQFPSHV
jgi:hypothetical protein